MIVVPHPSGGKVSDFTQFCPVEPSKPLVADCAVKAFIVRVLVRLTWPDTLESMTDGPAQILIAALMFSEPLSHRIMFGLLRQSMALFKARIFL